MKETIYLNHKTEIEINPIAPFSFDGTFHKPSHFPTQDVAFETDTYWQSMRFNGEIFGLKFANQGTIDLPQLTLSIYHKEDIHLDINKLVDEIEYRYDLNCDLNNFYSFCGSDSFLSPAIKHWNGMRLGTPYSFYEFMVVTTMLQNTVVRRSVQMLQNLFDSYGEKISFDNKTLCAFWMPTTIDQVEEQALRNIKLGYRAKTMKRQAAEYISGKANPKILRKLSKEDLKKALLNLYGIGPATVQYTLFEIFHHYDALDHIPPWEQKIYSKMFYDQELVDVPVILNDINKRYGKWKALAVHYIFEDLFWLRKNENVPWLEALIRL